jgi:hypothetical protein
MIGGIIGPKYRRADSVIFPWRNNFNAWETRPEASLKLDAWVQFEPGERFNVS